MASKSGNVKFSVGLHWPSRFGRIRPKSAHRRYQAAGGAGTLWGWLLKKFTRSPTVTILS